jgi:hypothetical protein
MNTITKKITLATLKSFIKNNSGKLFINVKSSFDGMIDGCASYHDGFVKAERDKTISINSDYHNSTQGIKGVWLVGSSRDYFKPYNDNRFEGIEVSNSCGHFIVATPKTNLLTSVS